MKCVKCGAEMKEGCIYCSVCGNEAQIVPDYSVLEDDYLRKLLKEENQPTKGKNQANKTDKKNQAKHSSSHMSNKIPIIIVCCILVIAITAGIHRQEL